MYLCIWLIKLGSGRHLSYIQFVLGPDNDVVNLTESLDFYAHLIYTTALMTARVSGLAFYWGIVKKTGSDYWLRRAILYGAGFVVATWIVQIMLIIFHCFPITSLWPYGWQTVEYNEYTGMLAWGTVYVTNSTISMVCDILMLGIPLALIQKLHTSRKRKNLLRLLLLPGLPYVKHEDIYSKEMTNSPLQRSRHLYCTNVPCHRRTMAARPVMVV